MQDETIACAIGADARAAREAGDELDRAALAAVGIDIGCTPINGYTTLSKHAPFTSAAKIVMRQTLVYATTEKAKSITNRHRRWHYSTAES